jgi:Copper binding proteins, plastocyanin/azurin family
MYRRLLIITLVIVAVSIPAAATGSSQAPNVTLTGVVGPGFTISLRNADGSTVRHLDPGTYDISVTDNAIEHNFHLSGPGVNQATEIEGTGPVSWTVTFTDGTYRFVCDPHAASMRGTFTVGNVPPPPPPPGKLSGKVTARTISLKKGSSKVKTLTAGKFKLAVSDTAKTQNFHLKGPGVNKKTGVAARSKATWTLTLKVGKYTYRSDKSRTLHGSFTVKAAS